MKNNINTINNLLEKYKEGLFNWDDAQVLLNFKEEYDWDSFFSNIANYRKNILKKEKILKSYTPGKNFPAISVTGTNCELNCEHCNKDYLKSMRKADTKESFVNEIQNAIDKGAIGALISGGSTMDGKVPVLKYKNQISELKKKHNFYMNSHVGLINQEEALELKQCGIDTVSYDLVLDQQVINNIFHLNKSPQDYINSYKALLEADLHVTPHMLIGAHYGKISQELKILKLLVANPPDILIFIIMIPPKFNGIISDKFNLISPIDVGKIIFLSSIFLPNTVFSLGCMRPKNRKFRTLEKWAIQIGVSRMEIPSQSTLKWAKDKGYQIQYFSACCSINNEFEKIAQSKDIRGNLDI